MLTFNHASNVLSTALNLTKEELTEVKSALIFSVLSPRVLGNTLFDDDSEIPDNMKSTSGSIEVFCDVVKSENMRIFGLVNFMHLYEQLMGSYLLLINKQKSDELLNDIEDPMERALKNVMLQMKLTPVKMLIEDIKQANGDFEKFHISIKKILDKGDKLHGLFDNKEEDEDDEE